MLASLQAEHSRLSALPDEPPTVTYEPTGETYRQHWARLTEQGRHTFLVRAGIRVDASMIRKIPYVHLHFGDLENLRKLAREG